MEMDPESAENARKKAEDNGEQILAWYHSHPFFEVFPSNVDIINHSNYQECFKKEDQPYVAIIIGPYTKRISKTTCRSLIKCFHTAGGQPYELKINLVPERKLSHNFLNVITHMVAESFTKEDKVDFEGEW